MGMKQLIESGSAEFSDFVGTIVAATKEHLGSDLSFLAEFRDDFKVIRKLAGDGSSVGVAEGTAFPLQETYCFRMARGELPNIIEQASNDERVKHLAITGQLKIETYLSVPVKLPDGRLYGSLCCLYRGMEPPLQTRDVKFMHVLASILGDHFGRLEEIEQARALRRAKIHSLIDQAATSMVFQPIVDLRTHTIVGVEALARFNIEPQLTPDAWFAEAWTMGLGCELEAAAVDAALARLPDLPADIYLSVNVSPDGLLSDAIFQSLAISDPSRLVVEVTEHAIVDDYQPLIEALKRLASCGPRLAVDDVGAGYSGLAHIIRTSPKIMKLDISLTSQICQDEAKQALVAAAVTFAARMGVDLVAEGIEDPDDARALQLLGVRYGQGFYFGEPAPLPLKVRQKTSSSR